MSLMNGVNSEELIAKHIGKEKGLLYSLIKVASHKENDEYIFEPATTIGIIFGETDTAISGERVKEVGSCFEKQ